MTHNWMGRCRRQAVASTALLATVATAVSFLSPVVPRAFAGGRATASVPQGVVNANCDAVLSGYTLSRSGWVASTNAPSKGDDLPANALDGDYSSRFSTDEHQVEGFYFKVDLGSVQAFDELQMASPGSPNDYARGFKVLVSSDGSSWKTVAKCTGSRTPEVVSFPTETARYVAVVLTEADSYWWWSIDEFNLFSAYLTPPTTTTTTTSTTSTTTTVPPTTTTTVVPGAHCYGVLSGYTLGRSGWVASTDAPSKGDDLPANALDGNYSSRFSSDEHQVPGLYFEVNLGTAQSFDELEMASPGSPNDYARGFKVLVSADGSSWATVAECSGSRTPEIVSFPTQTAQYVEVVLTTADSYWWWSIDEFNLFSASLPTTTTTTTTTSTTTTSTTTTTTVPPTTTTTVPPTTTTTVPVKHRGCPSVWPPFLSRGSLIEAHDGFYVVIARCLVERVLEARVLVIYRLVKRDHRVRVVFRWSYHFKLGSPMDKRVVEFRVSKYGWVRWNGCLYYIRDLRAMS